MCVCVQESKQIEARTVIHTETHAMWTPVESCWSTVVVTLLVRSTNTLSMFGFTSLRWLEGSKSSKNERAGIMSQ